VKLYLHEECGLAKPELFEQKESNDTAYTIPLKDRERIKESFP